MKLDIDNAQSESVRIEILPLIDVIFCILTFFILAAVGLTRQQAISLDLPGANTGAALSPESRQARDQRLYISVDASGQTYLDQQPVDLALLTDVLMQHREFAPDGLIVLYASRNARYESVVQVLDLLREVGGDRVALATLPGTQDADPDLDPDFPTSEDDFNDLFSPGAPDFPNLDAPLTPDLTPFPD